MTDVMQETPPAMVVFTTAGQGGGRIRHAKASTLDCIGRGSVGWVRVLVTVKGLLNGIDQVTTRYV